MVEKRTAKIKQGVRSRIFTAKPHDTMKLDRLLVNPFGQGWVGLAQRHGDSNANSSGAHFRLV